MQTETGTEIESDSSVGGSHPVQHVHFDPDRLAYLEVAGWRAYYDRKWLQCFKLITQLAHEQFGLSWARALQAAYYITRASVAWAPVDNDRPTALLYIRRFYQVAARNPRSFRFDPDQVADLEYIYWDVHRRLSGKPDNEKEPLIRSFAALHSALFNLPESSDAVWASAIDRAHSADTVDLITSRRSTDVPADWRRCEEYLRAAYHSLVS